MNLLDLIQQKLELFRLEQRYTKKRNRRSTFVSEALYVDGEYIYSPTSSYSARCHADSSDGSELERGSKGSSSKESRRGEKRNRGEEGKGDRDGGEKSNKETKLNRRLSRMGLEKMDWRKGKGGEEMGDARVSVREVRWDGGAEAERRLRR